MGGAKENCGRKWNDIIDNVRNQNKHVVSFPFSWRQCDFVIIVVVIYLYYFLQSTGILPPFVDSMSGPGRKHKPFKQPQFFCKHCNCSIQNRSRFTQHNNLYHSKPVSPDPAQHADEAYPVDLKSPMIIFLAPRPPPLTSLKRMINLQTVSRLASTS